MNGLITAVEAGGLDHPDALELVDLEPKALGQPGQAADRAAPPPPDRRRRRRIRV